MPEASGLKRNAAVLPTSSAVMASGSGELRRAYSMVSITSRLGPLVRAGGAFVSLTYMASERVIPGYGGGMSSAKAALESDTRVLAYEAGRKWGARVNCSSGGPLASRAASAIGFIAKIITYYQQSGPLPETLTANEVGYTAAFLASPLGTGITGSVVYVDKGYHAMAIPHDVERSLTPVAKAE